MIHPTPSYPLLPYSPLFLSLGAGLMRDQRHAEHLPGRLGRFVGILGELHTTALAAPAGVDLGLDDDPPAELLRRLDRKSTRLNSSHLVISYAVFCLKKKK